MRNVNAIYDNALKYEMTHNELVAYKCAAIYQHLVKKMFPKFRMVDIHVGDPRKKELFKYCWKMVREIEGVVSPDDYKSYIYAQLAVFKAYMNQETPPFIHPNCLTGQRALHRWFYFKKQLDKRKQYETLKEQRIEVNPNDRVVQELEMTKRFFAERGVGDVEKIRESLRDGSFQRWVALRQVSPYFVLMSPTVRAWLESQRKELTDVFGLGIKVYRSGITENSAAFFEKEFASCR